MSVSVDPRLAARRQQVQESWARRRLRWIVGLVGVVIVVGVAVALLQSPWLAVRTINVSGASNADVAPVLAAHDVVAGVPTISVRSGEIETSLRTDPWVAQADVSVTWPGTVEITVLERTAAAWVQGPAGWWLVSADGVVLTDGTPGAGEPVVYAGLGGLSAGMRIERPDIVGAFEFLALLPPDLAVGATAEVTLEGIEVLVQGHQVLAGNYRDIPAKVATAVAMLERGVEEGWTVNVISPERPGTLNPQPVVEGTGEDVSSSDDSG
ncbi:MAG TPA: FtsQ-type POTRA domain-containing protein [Acidimicrobiia bacterium]|jgi:cell division protein FtsQ|nr:FtsQ-type POTRA domain-containing protein [Acidimicrobiia bacterium]